MTGDGPQRSTYAISANSLVCGKHEDGGELGEGWGISGGSRWIETCAKGKLLRDEPIPALGPNPLLCPMFTELAFLRPDRAAGAD